MAAFNAVLDQLMPSLFRMAARGHWMPEKQPVRRVRDGSVLLGAVETTKTGDLWISVQPGSTDVSLLIGFNARDLIYPVSRYAQIRELNAMLKWVKILAGLPLAWRWAQVAGFDIATLDRARVLADARRYLATKPATVTASRSPPSAGGPNDFFSEGDYWWPDPKNPDGPYTRRDGMTNPANFVDHRNAMKRLSVEAPALGAAWQLTKQRRYADHAAAHLRAWFLDPGTRMTPHLQYAQAIKGRSTGRGTGIIDTIHLVEVARAVPVIAAAGALRADELAGVRRWFTGYSGWLCTSKNGYRRTRCEE